MEKYFAIQKDMAQKGKKRKNLDAEEKEDEMVDQMKASMGNKNVKGNDKQMQKC